jgi:hypothetical protein
VQNQLTRRGRARAGESQRATSDEHVTARMQQTTTHQVLLFEHFFDF